MTNKQELLITGGSGFVGSALLVGLQKDQYLSQSTSIKTVDRQGVGDYVVEDFNGETDWSAAVAGVDIVIHCAARAHVAGPEAGNALAWFRETNTSATLGLAYSAAMSGVKRFIFISSIGVNGNKSVRPFSPSDCPMPTEAYAKSKLEAERGLWKIQRETGMEVVVIRPPLVYGFGAPGNFGKLLKLAKKSLPLPLGAISNKKSFVALDNLIDLIVTCIDHPNAANETFLVSDDHDLSTTELLTLMTQAAGKRPRLLPVPMSVIQWGASVLGKKAVADRLCESLQVDVTHTKETLGWRPPVSVEEGIRRCFES